MNTILAIDTSTEACSAALLFNGEVTGDFVVSQREHTKQILPMIDNLLNKSACTLSQIDAIAFGQGPGSFTGVRIGIGVAQGLALGIDRPVIGVSTLMTLAQGAYRTHQAGFVVSAIDARMGEIYLGAYQHDDKGNWLPVIKECVIKPHAIHHHLAGLALDSKEVYCAGTGWQTYPNMIDNINNSQHILPDAQDMIVIAQSLLSDNKMMRVEDIEPTYLRNEVTWKKLPGR